MNQVSENDNYYDMWPMRDVQIESDVNKQFSFSMSDYLNDPVKQMVAKYLTSQEVAKRVLPNADSVSPDLNGLQILIVIIIHLIQFF